MIEPRRFAMKTKGMFLTALVSCCGALACSSAQSVEVTTRSADREATSQGSVDDTIHTVVVSLSDRAPVLELDWSKETQSATYRLPDGHSATLKVEGEVTLEGQNQLAQDLADERARTQSEVPEVHCMAFGFNGGTCWCFYCQGQPDSCYGGCS
jgi:hypothetical protein